MSMTGAQLRSAFLEYFGKNGHKILPSASLVPGNDPTLFFAHFAAFTAVPIISAACLNVF